MGTTKTDLSKDLAKALAWSKEKPAENSGYDYYYLVIGVSLVLAIAWFVVSMINSGESEDGEGGAIDDIKGDEET